MWFLKVVKIFIILKVIIFKVIRCLGSTGWQRYLRQYHPFRKHHQYLSMRSLGLAYQDLLNNYHNYCQIWLQMLTSFADGALLQGSYLVPSPLQTLVAVEHFGNDQRTFSDLMQLAAQEYSTDSAPDAIKAPDLPGLQVQNHHGLGWELTLQSLEFPQEVHLALVLLYFPLMLFHLTRHLVIY